MAQEAVDWYRRQMTPRKAAAVLRWAQLGCNLCWMWREMWGREDGDPQDWRALVRAAQQYFAARHVAQVTALAPDEPRQMRMEGV